jgi:O-antigen/teichoic acid export membrane protein
METQTGTEKCGAGTNGRGHALDRPGSTKNGEPPSVPPFMREVIRPDFVLWATKGALAIGDQTFFAGTHFLLNVLLARWLTPVEYGAFALAYSVFVLLASVHSATFVEPMLVFGAGNYSERLDEYLGILIRGHFLLMAPVRLLMAAAAFVIIRWSSSATVGHAFLTLAFAIPFILLLWMLRRAFYVELRPGWAMLGAVLYFVVLTALIFLFRATNELSTVTALAMMSGAAFIVSCFLLLRLRPKLISAHEGLESIDVARAHWFYGRWSVAAAAVGWIPLNIYYLVLPIWFGLAGTATLRALINLINPILHILVALGALLLPILVRNRRNGGKTSMNHTMFVSLGIFLAGSGLFSCFLWVFRSEAFHLFYGGKYQFGSGPLCLLLVSLVGTCITTVLGAGLMALERPDGNFWSFIAASVLTIVVGVPLAALRGVQGAAEGLLLSVVGAALFMYFFYRRAGSVQTNDQGGLGEYVPLAAEPEGTLERQV